jgi:beta-lactamase regulating signal transducer with metallopeptidase domain
MCLGHEFQHIRQGDVDAEIMLSLVSPLLILNPGFWFIAGRVRGLAELACDRAFLARQRMGARDYSLRLLNIARAHLATRASEPNAFGVPLIGRTLPWMPRKSMLKARIEEIAADANRPTRETRVLAAGASLVLAGLILVVAVAFGASGDWSHERIMLSTVVNLERINELNTLAQRSW